MACRTARDETHGVKTGGHIDDSGSGYHTYGGDGGHLLALVNISLPHSSTLPFLLCSLAVHKNTTLYIWCMELFHFQPSKFGIYE